MYYRSFFKVATIAATVVNAEAPAAAPVAQESQCDCNDIGKLESHVKTLQNQCEVQLGDLTTQLNTSEENQKQMQAEFQGKMEASNAELEREKKGNEGNQAELSKKNEMITGLSKENDDMKATLSSNVQTIQELTAKAQQSENLLSQTQASLSQAKSASQSETANVSEKLKEMAAEKEKLEAKMKEDKASSETSMKEMNAEKTKLKDSLKEKEGKMKKMQKELEASKKAVSESKKNIESLQSEVEALGELNVAKSAGFISNYWNKSLMFTGILYRDLIEPQYTPTMELLEDNLTTLKHTSTLLFDDFKVLSSQLYKEGSTIAIDTYSQQIYPLVVLAQMEMKNLYNAHIVPLDIVDPTVTQVKTMIKDFQLDKMYNDTYKQGNKMMITGKKMWKKEVSPMMEMGLKTGVEMTNKGLEKMQDLSELKEFLEISAGEISEGVNSVVFQPVNVEFLSGEMEFENGYFDMVLYGIMTVAVMYFFVYNILFQYVFWKFGVKFLTVNCLYRAFLKTFLYRFIISLSWKIVSFALSTVIFFGKLSMCCGCCCYCFRSADTSPKVVNIKKGGNMAAQPNKAKIQQQAAAAQAQAKMSNNSRKKR